MEQGIKLDILVAPDAWIWCPAQAILSAEIGNDHLGKNISKVHHIVGDTQSMGNPLGILYRSQTATATRAVLLIRRPDLHGDADYLISLVL
jgi:hypothetical protein